MKLINLPEYPKTIKIVGCPTGSEKRPAWKYVYDENYGCPRRVKNGEVNVQDLIQQSADDVDFKSIGTGIFSQLPTHRVGQFSYLSDALGHTGNTIFG